MNFSNKSAYTASAIFGLLLLGTQSHAAECKTSKPITVAEMTWLSSGALAYLTKDILQDGYGCEVTVVPGDTVPTAASMLAKGEPDIAPELWVSTVQSTWDKMKAEGKIYKAGDIFAGGGQEGWWVPDYFAAEHPEIKSVSDLKDNWKAFEDPSAPGKGRFYACPPGWGCEIISNNLIKALGMDKTFEVYPTGSGANLKATIARQVARKKPFLGWYWGPTEVIGKYHLKLLEMPAFDAAKFKCLTDVNCPNPQSTGWAVGEVVVAVNTRIKTEAPEAAEFLSKMQLPNDDVNTILAWGDDNKATPAEVATYILKNYPNIWTNWVSEEAAAKIKVKLQ